MISKQTCTQIWNAWNEIDRAKGLIEKLAESVKNTSVDDQPSLKNAFGDNNGIQLGIPYSSSGTNIISGVSPVLTLQIIEAHIKKQEARLEELAGIAKMELYKV